VALKVLHRGRPEEERQRRGRFHREGQLSARLDHPHIVRVHDYAEHDGLLYFTMEFLEGGSLRHKLRREGRLDPGTAAQLIGTLTDAVQHAHGHGIIHRDLKPSNVLFTRDGLPKVADFGLAKNLDSDSTSLTIPGQILGTYRYVAPEQAAGEAKEAGPGVDTYALGVILFECLADRTPFISEDLRVLLAQILTQTPSPPSRHQLDVPPILDAVCLRCLQKEPESRYASAVELGDDLRRFLAGGTTLEPTPPHVWTD
jgi:serine/threonine-protein kinase